MFRFALPFFSSRTFLRGIHTVPKHALYSKVIKQPILQDNYGRFHNYLRVSITERCNFKCRYCTISDESIEYTPQNQLLTHEQLMRCIRLFTLAGVEKIRLTGGEATINKGFSRLMYEIGTIPTIKTLALTTNASMLWKKLDEYKKNGLTHLNISLDTFDAKKNEYITQTKFHSHVLRSIDKALELNYHPLKINCVVMKGINDDEILRFVEWTRDQPVNVRFIEFFAIGDNHWSKDKMVSYKEMKDKIEQQFGPLVREQDAVNDTAKNFKLPGFVGTVSFITPATENFCGSCNRIRLLSTGEFRRCLHDDDMLNLKTLIDKGYPDDVLLEAISFHLKGKKREHADMDYIAKHMTKGKSMVQLGG